jgi:hypothetical protein
MFYQPGWQWGKITPALEVTAGLSPNSIWFVTSRTAKTLTKRRAVDFCHVATAICPRPAALIPAFAGAALG